MLFVKTAVAFVRVVFAVLLLVVYVTAPARP